MNRDVTFTPPNHPALWASLELTKTQLAALCGVTVRQVDHWIKRGYLPTSPRHPDRYTGEAVDLCILIRQALRQGVPVRRAAALARAYYADQLAEGSLLGTAQPPTMLDLHGTLRQAADLLTEALATVEARVARVGDEVQHHDH